MPVTLNTSDADFEARFTDMLSAKREDSADVNDVVAGIIADLRAGGETNGVKHLLPHFSHADIAMAQVLAFVEPPSTHLRMTDGIRESFRDPELAERYDDLLSWRDALYEQFRGPERRR